MYTNNINIFSAIHLRIKLHTTGVRGHIHFHVDVYRGPLPPQCGFVQYSTGQKLLKTVRVNRMGSAGACYICMGYCYRLSFQE